MRSSAALHVILFLLQPSFLFEALSQTDVTTAPMEEKEKQALYYTIQGFVGKWWNGSELYPDPCGWTTIQGVSCDVFDNSMWYVTAIYIGPIYDNTLECSKKAEFSPYLFELRHLKSLSIFNCFSTPNTQQITIPADNWNKLSSSMQNLELRSNKGLLGKVPHVLGQLVNLQSLVLSNNSLTGELPGELGNLVHLKRLTLSGNQLYGNLPGSLGATLAELLILDISNNHLVGPLHSSLGGLTSLLKLDLSNNLLNGSLPLELSKLKNLTLLDLRNNNLSGALNPSLLGMVSLQEMVLSNNPFGETIEKFDWKSLENLTYLDLSNMGLVGGIPDSITGLKKLRFLSLKNNQLSGFVPPKLADMLSLSALYINGNNLSGELGFPEDFYKRTRFASWNNPNLCYNSGAGKTTGQGPIGVDKCINRDGNSVHHLDLGENVLGEQTTQGFDGHVSFGSSAYPLHRFLWIAFLELVAILFLCY